MSRWDCVLRMVLGSVIMLCWIHNLQIASSLLSSLVAETYKCLTTINITATMTSNTSIHGLAMTAIITTPPKYDNNCKIKQPKQKKNSNVYAFTQ